MASIFTTIGGVIKKIVPTINSVISKIYGQKVNLGLAVVPEEVKLPSIIPKIQILPGGMVTAKEEINYTPYLIVGGVIILLILVLRR